MSERKYSNPRNASGVVVVPLFRGGVSSAVFEFLMFSDTGAI
jgi:hypothetical protein